MAAVHISQLSDLSSVISENEKVVIKFSTAWCGPCKMYNPIFEDTSNDHPEVKFVMVDVGDAPDIGSYFKVSNVPTTIITDNGSETHRLVGVQPKKTLSDLIV